MGSSDDKPIRYHIFKEHLVGKECKENEVDSDVIKSIVNDLLDCVENENKSKRYPTTLSRYLFRCNQCPSGTTTFDCKNELNKHVKAAHLDCVNRLKCVYCLKSFETKSIGDYLTHLKNNHKQFIINDLLLNKKSFSQAKFDHYIDWSEYFFYEAVSDVVLEPSNSKIGYSKLCLSLNHSISKNFLF